MTGMKQVFIQLGNGFMAAWTMTTTIVYTVVLGIPAIFASLMSATGKVPFAIGRAWAWLIMKTNRVRLQVVGLEKIVKERSYVFISNHASNLDTPAVAVALRKPLRFVAKKSLAKVPIFGWATRLMRMIFIDRTDGAKAIEVLNKAVTDLKDGISAYVFAEGTRSTDGMLKAFKKGGVILALKAKLPIIPITIIGSHDRLPKNSLRIRPGEIKVIVGDPIDTTAYTEKDKDLLLQKVRDAIADTLRRYNELYQTGMSRLSGKTTLIS